MDMQFVSLALYMTAFILTLLFTIQLLCQFMGQRLFQNNVKSQQFPKKILKKR